MVSWGDGEESSEDNSNATSEGVETLYDSEWEGLAEGRKDPHCKCGGMLEKFVAWEGAATGRRYMTCVGQFGLSCEYIKWVDGEGPTSLQKALLKLWQMYGEVKEGRVSDALRHVDEKFNFRDEITKLHRDLKIVQDEVEKTENEEQVTLALKAQTEQALIDARAELQEKKKLDTQASNMHGVLRIKAEKERDKLKEDKRKLESMVAEFVKKNDGSGAKIRKIKDLLDEL